MFSEIAHLPYVIVDVGIFSACLITDEYFDEWKDKTIRGSHVIETEKEHFIASTEMNFIIVCT